MATNNFLPFCPTDTGTNLLSQSAYAADAQLLIGNQPGIARSTLVNKALRQATAVAAQLAQVASNITGASTLDDGTSGTTLLGILTAAFTPAYPDVRQFLSGSGTYNLPYVFTIASGSATAGATYTNNSTTYTVVSTVASGTQIRMTGSGAPTASGSLTKASGTGDATLTFYAFRAPAYLRVLALGGGGGGGGSSDNGHSNGGVGGGGTATTFGTALISAAAGGVGQGGGGSYKGTVGGGYSISAPAIGFGAVGASGQGGYQYDYSSTSYAMGGNGGNGGLGGSGVVGGEAGSAASANSGGGGGGGGGVGASASASNAGSGGGQGGFADAIVPSPSATYAYSVGTGGAGGTAGTGGVAGGAGGSGQITVIAYFE